MNRRINLPLEIVPARARHIGFLARHMRTVDRRECAAMMGRDPRGSLRHALAASTHAWTALVEGRPHAMFGLVIESALTGRGVPWFLGTDEVWRHPRALLAIGPQVLSTMHDSSPTLANLVSADNAPAIRLLQKWGFTVNQHTILVGGLAFRPFERVRLPSMQEKA